MRCSIGTTDPHAYRVTIAQADSPGVSETAACTSLPCEPAVWTAAFHNASHRPARLENAANDEGRAFAHHAALLDGRTRKKSRCAGQAFARQRGISTDPVFECRARSAEN